MPLSASVDSRGGKIKCEEVSVFLSYVAGFGGFGFDISAGLLRYCFFEFLILIFCCCVSCLR